jgi:hypothetical protein
MQKQYSHLYKWKQKTWSNMLQVLRNKAYLMLETGKKPSTKYNVNDCLLLADHALTSLGTMKEPDGKRAYWHIKTRTNNKKAHKTSAQILACLCALELYKLYKKEKYLEAANNLAKYICMQQDRKGMIRSNNPSNLLQQQEGLDTYWTITILSRLYETTKKKNYLRTAYHAAIASRKLLYSEDFGYVHTAGQKSWCTNASACAAHALIQLHHSCRKNEILKWARDGITHVLLHQAENGLFYYSSRIRSIRVSAYHAGVILYLLWYQEKDYSNVISEAIIKAAEYQKWLERDDGSIREPDLQYYARATSVSTSAALEAKLGHYEKARKIMNFFCNFVKHGIVYMNYKNGKLYHGAKRYKPECNLFATLRNVALYKIYSETGGQPTDA